MNKKQILFSALFLTFACASAGAAPPEPSALGAFCPPSEGKSFHSGWISLGLKAADLKEKQASAGHITDVGEAQVLLHFPAGWKPQDKRTALCIFPGGGYSIQAIEKEGCRIAGWAAEHGMVGVIVKYRVSGTNNAVGRFPGPLLDARQALRTVRENASSLGIDPLRIGVMGFSAGGHLAAMASTLWNRTLPEEAENPLKEHRAGIDRAGGIYVGIIRIYKRHFSNKRGGRNEVFELAHDAHIPQRRAFIQINGKKILIEAGNLIVDGINLIELAVQPLGGLG